MPDLRRIFLQDLGTKVLALILALAVYVHVFSGQEREMVYGMPLQIAPLPPSLAFATEPPTEVRVRVRGAGKELLKLRTKRAVAEVDLGIPRPGELQRPILGSDVRLPRDVKTSSVEVIEPRTLDVVIEPKANTRLPIAVRLRGGAEAEVALASRPVTEPRTVRVSGPSSRIAAAESISTIPVAMPSRPGVQDREVELDPPPGVVPEIRKVTVHVDVDRRVERRFGPLPVELVPSQGNRLIWIQPDSGTVTVSGAESLVRQSLGERVRLLAELRHRDARSQWVALRGVVPGLPDQAPVTVRCEPESVSVRLQ